MGFLRDYFRDVGPPWARWLLAVATIASIIVSVSGGTLHVPAWKWLTLGVLLFVIAQGLAYFTKWKQTLPRIVMEYDESNQTFLQRDALADTTTGGGMTGFTYRIGLRTAASQRTIRNVSVIVESHAPQATPHPDRTLVPGVFDLRPGRTKWVDVLVKHTGGIHQQESLIQYADPQLFRAIQDLSEPGYAFVLLATGDDVPSTRVTFQYFVDLATRLPTLRWRGGGRNAKAYSAHEG